MFSRIGEANLAGRAVTNGQQRSGRTAEVMQDSRGLVGLERPTWQVEQVRMDSRGQTGQQRSGHGQQRSRFRSYIYIDRVGL
jgi:hypothetical protein